MKKCLILIMFLTFNINLVKADLLSTALIIGALDSPSYVIKKDKYSEMLDVIKQKLPYKSHYASFESIEFDLPVEDQSYFLSYFKNEGYNNVSIKNGKLFFDYKGHSAMRKKLDAEEKASNRIIYIVSAIFFGIFVFIQFSLFVITEISSNVVSKINSKIIDNAKNNNAKKEIKLYTINGLSYKDKINLIKNYNKVSHQHKT